MDKNTIELLKDCKDSFETFSEYLCKFCGMFSQGSCYQCLVKNSQELVNRINNALFELEDE